MEESEFVLREGFREDIARVPHVPPPNQIEALSNVTCVESKPQLPERFWK